MIVSDDNGNLFTSTIKGCSLLSVLVHNGIIVLFFTCTSLPEACNSINISIYSGVETSVVVEKKAINISAR